MKFTANVGDESQLLIPEEVVSQLHPEAGTAVDVEVHKSAAREFDAERFKRVLDKYQGSMREQMLAEGYASVDDLMNDIRPPW